MSFWRTLKWIPALLAILSVCHRAGGVPQHPREGPEGGMVEIHGQVLPAEEERCLPPVVQLILRGAARTRPFEEKQYLSGTGEFRFRVPEGDYLLLVLAEGYTGSAVELDREHFVTGRQRVLVALGTRLEAPQPPSGAAVVDLSTLQIPPQALHSLDKAEREIRKRRWDKAVEHLLRALEIHPHFFPALNNLGAAYVRLGRFEEARHAFERALEIQPSALVYKNLGLAYLAEQQWLLGSGCLQRAAELAPDEADTYLWLGEALYRLKDPERAEANLRQALQLDPKLSRAHLVLGYVFLEVARREEALQAFQRFLEQEPGRRPPSCCIF